VRSERLDVDTLLFSPFIIYLLYLMSSVGAASWTYDAGSNTLEINWGKKYGNYTLIRTSETALEGSVSGNPSKWRKMNLIRPFSPAEQLMLGEGGGSVWEMSWEKGVVGEIEFRGDGFNHFVSKYPAHSHWSMNADGKVTLDWGKYGKYTNSHATSEVTSLI
jgi:hypothetical protein